jgi:pimeloyl-ACP methyl ester carboxylesterase
VVVALDYIQTTTGHAEIFVGGISQGGMIALAAMEFYPEMIKGGVILAPTILVGGISPLLDLLWAFPLLNVFIPSNYIPRQDTIFPMENTVNGIVEFLRASGMTELLVSDLMRFLYNPGNVELDRIENLFLEGISDIAYNEWIQLWRGAGLFLSNGVRSFPGSAFYEEYGPVNYASEMIRIEKPCLITAGAVDWIVPREKTLTLFDRLTRCEDKTILELSREAGCRYDYGHVDQIAGNRAEEEVFLPILRWILNHA